MCLSRLSLQRCIACACKRPQEKLLTRQRRQVLQHAPQLQRQPRIVADHLLQSSRRQRMKLHQHKMQLPETPCALAFFQGVGRDVLHGHRYRNLTATPFHVESYGENIYHQNSNYGTKTQIYGAKFQILSAKIQIFAFFRALQFQLKLNPAVLTVKRLVDHCWRTTEYIRFSITW